MACGVWGRLFADVGGQEVNPRVPLFFLPVHLRSYEDYYRDHDAEFEKVKRDVEENWKRATGRRIPFEKLSQETQVGWEAYFWWPPWKYNDIAGFLDIGMDEEDCFEATIFLKRKLFPRGSRERRFRPSPGHGPLVNNQFLYFREIPKVRVVDLKNNESYLQALGSIIDESIKVIRERKRSLELWLPPFDFSCLNFVEAYRQARTEERTCARGRPRRVRSCHES